MAFQKKKIQIAVTLLLTLGSSWGYHTAMVVEELTLEGGNDKLKRSKSMDDALLERLHLDSKGPQCRKLHQECLSCQASSKDNSKDNELKKQKVLSQIDEDEDENEGKAEGNYPAVRAGCCDWLLIKIGCLNAEEKAIQGNLTITLSLHKLRFNTTGDEVIAIINLRDKSKGQEFLDLEDNKDKADYIFNHVIGQFFLIKSVQADGEAERYASQTEIKSFLEHLLVNLNVIDDMPYSNELGLMEAQPLSPPVQNQDQEPDQSNLGLNQSGNSDLLILNQNQ